MSAGGYLSGHIETEIARKRPLLRACARGTLHGLVALPAIDAA